MEHNDDRGRTTSKRDSPGQGMEGRSIIKGGAHSNHYRMQECTSSRPHPTTHHKPLTANDIHTILYSIRLHANVYESINGRGQNTYARVARTYIIHEAGRPLGRDYIRTA